MPAHKTSHAIPHPLHLLLVAWIVASVAMPAAAERDPAIRLASNFADPFLEAFKATDPCGLDGINPGISGLCTSVSNSGGGIPMMCNPESNFAAPVPDRKTVSLAGNIETEPCAEELDLGLELWTQSRKISPTGDEVVSVVPKGRDLFSVPEVETSCGTWRVEMVIDPLPLQTPSKLTLHRDLPSSESGSTSGALTLGVRSRFLRADGALVEIPTHIDLEMEGSWQRTLTPGGPWSERLELGQSPRYDSCWKLHSIGGELVLMSHCLEPTCPNAEPPCGLWCEVDPLPSIP